MYLDLVCVRVRVNSIMLNRNDLSALVAALFHLAAYCRCLARQSDFSLSLPFAEMHI